MFRKCFQHVIYATLEYKISSTDGHAAAVWLTLDRYVLYGSIVLWANADPFAPDNTLESSVKMSAARTVFKASLARVFKTPPEKKNMGVKPENISLRQAHFKDVGGERMLRYRYLAFPGVVRFVVTESAVC